MPLTVKEMIAAANSVVERIDIATAQEKVAGGAVLLDVRDSNELAATGKAEGALHISRGMLEFLADPAMPTHAPELSLDRPVVLYCVSGGRAALAGKLLKDMGYAEVYNIGGLKDWAEAGGPVDRSA